jgi:hypothetical protein
MPGRQPGLWASDVDRDAGSSELGDHFQAGRLDMAEFGQRRPAGPNDRPAPAGSSTGAQQGARQDEDKVALVTGATSGIGYHTARELAARGTTVMLSGRDPRRGADAVAAIVAAVGHSRVHFLPADHATVGANQQLARAVPGQLEQHGLPQRLDVLVNNVGGIFAARTLTADGYEASLAVNFLGPYVLTRSCSRCWGRAGQRGA